MATSLEPASVLARAVLPLASLDPTQDAQELAPLVELVGDARVVAIGESAHLTHEFSLLRDRLTRFLVERLGFDAVIYESGFAEGFVVDAWIRGGEGDVDNVRQRGFTYQFGQCQEIRDQLNWLRTWNASHPTPVRFYGMDLAASMASMSPDLAPLVAYLEAVDPAQAPRLARLRALVDRHASTEFGAALAAYCSLSAAERNEQTGLLVDAVARFEAMRLNYLHSSSAEEYERARRHLHLATRLDAVLRWHGALASGDMAVAGANIRDLAMAETVLWVLERHRRVVVLAANTHIQRCLVSPPGFDALRDTAPVGLHLASRLGQDYVAIGTTFGSGETHSLQVVESDGELKVEMQRRSVPPAEPTTLDGLLSSVTSTPALLDLRHLDAEAAALVDAAPSMRFFDTTVDVHARKAFDLVVHVPLVTPWHAR